MSYPHIKTAKRDLRLHEGAVKLLQVAAQPIEHEQCQDCTAYNVMQGALYCPELDPKRTSSGVIECTHFKKGGC